MNTTPAAAQTGQILILSSHNRPSLSSPVNHQRYAQRHGHGDLFDATPYPLTSPYDQKLWSIISNLERSTPD